MRSKLIALTFALLVSVGKLGWAQSAAPTLEDRLAALERRIEQLEQENRDLRTQVASVLPARGAPVEIASTTPVPAAAASSNRALVATVQAPTKPATQGAAARTAAVPPPAPAEGKPSDRFQFGGQIRYRAEVRQNNDLNSALPDVQDFIGQRIRFDIRAKLSDQVETFVQFQDSRLWGQELSTQSNENLVDLHQAYVQVNDFAAPGVNLRVGRQEMSYGSDRLIGRGKWDNVGRSFDALKLGYASKKVQLEWFAAKVVDRRSTGRGDRDQYLYGMYNQFFREKPQHLEVYGILFRDGLRATGEITAAGRKATEIMTVGLRSDGSIKPGISYDIEFADQFGHRGFDPHSARAFAGKFYKTLEEKHEFRLGFEYDVATGDSDPKDGRSGEFFNLFPTNHVHYGYMDLFGWRNMQDFRPMFTVRPVKALKFDIDYHRFYLLEPRGAWKNASGAVLGFDATEKSGAFVGDEVDFTAAFPIHKHLKILSGYGLFFPGEFAQKTRGSDTQHFFYLQTTVDF